MYKYHLKALFRLSLVTVNIDNISNTWNVLIGANDVSNTLLSMFKIQPIISSKADAFDLLNDCAKLKFCVGNEDFSDIFQEMKTLLFFVTKIMMLLQRKFVM